MHDASLAMFSPFMKTTLHVIPHLHRCAQHSSPQLKSKDTQMDRQTRSCASITTLMHFLQPNAVPMVPRQSDQQPAVGMHMLMMACIGAA